MPIKDFSKTQRVKPIVTVQVGATVPVGCRKAAIYAESPESGKCVNQLDGECPFIQKEKAAFDKSREPRFCPTARMNEAALKKLNLHTKPVQLGFFLLPDAVRMKMGLPDRPTEIPGIVLISHAVEEIRDQRGNIVAVSEPLDAIEQYPILDYNLMWWTRTELVCRGDGENAMWYPNSPENPKYRQQRECLYKDCPDFKKAGQCKESGEFFFRVKNSPGFPAMWRFQTRSAKAINYMLQELREIHHVIGHVSLLPLKLTLEKETGRPTVPRRNAQTGQVENVRITTEVYRVHIRTEFTMQGALESKRAAIAFLAGTTDTGTVKMLKDSTPERRPEPEPPVEAHATAPEGQWNETIDVEPEEVSPETPQKPNPAPAAPASAPMPSAPQKAPEPKSESPARQEKNGKPAKLTPTQQKEAFMKLQERLGYEIADCATLEKLKELPNRYAAQWEQIGRKPTPTDPDTFVIKMFQDKKNWFMQNQADVQKPASAPVPSGENHETPPPPAGSIEAKRLQVEKWWNENPPVITSDMKKVVGKTEFEQLSDDDIDWLYEIISDVLKGA